MGLKKLSSISYGFQDELGRTSKFSIASSYGLQD
jgi:hypothetical protein